MLIPGPHRGQEFESVALTSVSKLGQTLSYASESSRTSMPLSMLRRFFMDIYEDHVLYLFCRSILQLTALMGPSGAGKVSDA